MELAFFSSSPSRPLGSSGPIPLSEGDINGPSLSSPFPFLSSPATATATASTPLDTPSSWVLAGGGGGWLADCRCCSSLAVLSPQSTRGTEREREKGRGTTKEGTEEGTTWPQREREREGESRLMRPKGAGARQLNATAFSYGTHQCCYVKRILHKIMRIMSS